MSQSLTLPLPFLLERPQAVRDALKELSGNSGIEQRGAVFTKHEVVCGILDLCGYTADQNLAKIRLLEPAFGNGHFLVPAVTRLLASCRKQGISSAALPSVLQDAVCAVELHEASFQTTYTLLFDLLQEEGLTSTEADTLVDGWLYRDDYLLADLVGAFDVVVGNPPYVRQERVPAPLVKEYKRRFATLYDRADLYVLFFERSLDLLTPNGVLGFICANRWVKNKYGGPLRAKVAAHFNLDVYIDMEGIDAFHGQVDAYPAVTIIRRNSPLNSTTVVSGGRGTRKLSAIFSKIRPNGSPDPNTVVVSGLMNGRDPWLLNAPQILEHLRELELRFPTLEGSGAKVGIGVATGCDKIYIGKHEKLPVENARKLPLVLASDLKAGGISWSGHGLVNPWLKAGKLAELSEYPLFSAYLKMHETQLRARHTARKSPQRWYKTIDRVYPELTRTPKLLIPDIKGDATVVFDAGEFYPHHNLYVITSDVWDLQVLQALLKSSISLMFVAAYCVRMAGGFLRFQAQYLRRIRVPEWHSIDKETRDGLRQVAHQLNQDQLDRLAFKAYGLSGGAADAIRKFAAQARVKGNNADSTPAVRLR